MAGLADFVKVSEDDLQVTYHYGQGPENLDRSFTIDKQTLQPPEEQQPDLGLSAVVALTKIVTTFKQRGTWPDRGTAFV